MSKQHVDVIIIGGGAAGFFAAINIAELYPHLSVAILEKTSHLLKKVKISGGGRCNVTHACFNPKDLINFYPRGGKELLGAFYQFLPLNTIEWFASKNIELTTESDGRMFPVSNTSETIVNCFLHLAQKHKIAIITETKVEKILPFTNGFEITTNNGEFTAEKIVVTAGGFNKAEQYQFLTDLGHTIQPPIPSLFTFNLPQHPICELQGISLPHVAIKIKDSNYKEEGPLLITHWGMSGPVVLKLSAWAARFLQEKNYNFTYFVNWLPNLSAEQILEQLTTFKTTVATKKVSNAFPFDFPKKLALYFLQKATIDENINWGDVSKKQLHLLTNILAADEYFSKGKTTFKQEFVTCGGIKLNEVNFKTMESKLHSNLFFSGEVLDIDALTGGFNFQAAWTTAWISAQHI
ncbi:MAG: NAD(P)/FAD-dependent oxidoreductase [Vicingaceae bacterium]|nr:NAD(P)/FAD-dependent oxidoreductase [Vicingaceae bacterium]